MIKVWSPYGWNWPDDPVQIVRMHSRGVDAGWMKAASAQCFAKEFNEIELSPGHTLVHVAPVADFEYFSCFVAGTEVRMAEFNHLLYKLGAYNHRLLKICTDHEPLVSSAGKTDDIALDCSCAFLAHAPCSATLTLTDTVAVFAF